MVKYMSLTSKEIKIYMYLLVIFCFITVFHSPEALIHCIRVLSSVYNCYISKINTQIIYFSSCLNIAGPRVDPERPGPEPAKISQPWPGQYEFVSTSARNNNN